MADNQCEYTNNPRVDVPTYLTYYFRTQQMPFHVLSDLPEAEAQEILTHDVRWRGDGTYLMHRKHHEVLLRQKFIQKGGQPRRQAPIYMILGESPRGPHDLEKEYNYKIKIPLAAFTSKDISFTYPDSLFEVPLDDLGKIDLPRNEDPVVYRMEELADLIQKYKVYEYGHHYIEAQVWNDGVLKRYKGKERWEACGQRG